VQFTVKTVGPSTLGIGSWRSRETDRQTYRQTDRQRGREGGSEGGREGEPEEALRVLVGVLATNRVIYRVKGVIRRVKCEVYRVKLCDLLREPVQGAV
jgi:hypothetical protein